MMSLEFFNDKFTIIGKGYFQLLAIKKRNIINKEFWNVNSARTIAVNVKFAYRFFHILGIIKSYINLFISLQIRKVYILINPYGNIHLCNEVQRYD